MGSIRHVCYVLAILVNCFGCQEVPLSSDLVSSPPESIIGYTLILRVTYNDGNPSNLSVGRAYAFSFAGQREVIIHGQYGQETLHQSVRWSYTTESYRATVTIDDVPFSHTYVLTFTSSDAGHFNYNGQFPGLAVWATGTFTITPN